MKKVLGILVVLVFSVCAFVFAETAGLREYYYFFSVESPDDLEVIKINEAGQLLDGPRVLRNSNDVDGVCATKTSTGKIVVYTLNNDTRGVKRWDFTAPGTISGGNPQFTNATFNFNIDCTANLAGAVVGSSEGGSKGNAIAHQMDSSGFSSGKFYNPIPRLDQTEFASIRADGKELIVVSLCCKTPEIAVQPLDASFHALGTPIVSTRVKSFAIDMVRLSADGRFALAASDPDGFQLYTLDPISRKASAPATLTAANDLVHFDSTVINENGTFMLYNDLTDGGTTWFQELDGAGHFSGSAVKVISVGDHYNFANLIRAN